MCCLCQENVLQRFLVFLNMKKIFSHSNIRFGLSELNFQSLKPLYSSGLFFMRQTVHDLNVGFNIWLKRLPHFFELSPKPGRMCELLFFGTRNGESLCHLCYQTKVTGKGLSALELVISLEILMRKISQWVLNHFLWMHQLCYWEVAARLKERSNK